MGAGRARYRLPSSDPTMIRRRGQHRAGGPATTSATAQAQAHAAAAEAAALGLGRAAMSRAATGRSGELSSSELSAVQHLLPPASALSASLRESTGDTMSGKHTNGKFFRRGWSRQKISLKNTT